MALWNHTLARSTRVGATVIRADKMSEYSVVFLLLLVVVVQPSCVEVRVHCSILLHSAPSKSGPAGVQHFLRVYIYILTRPRIFCVRISIYL